MVSLFGTLFSEINISRTTTANVVSVYTRVPITYAQKEKMLARVQQANTADRASASLTLPVMSFELLTVVYDGDRKLTTTGRSAYINASSSSNFAYQYNPVPYDLKFALYVWAKNAEDGAKIVEQIFPYFTPAFSAQVILVPELGIKHIIPVILDSVAQNDAYEGDFKVNQPIVWTLNFTVKTNFYGPTKNAPIILFANTNYRVVEFSNTNIATQAVGNTNIAGYISVYPGEDANGNPTSNPLITVPANTIFVNSNFGYITVYSEPTGDLVPLSVDTTGTTVDNAILSVDQTERHNYVT